MPAGCGSRKETSLQEYRSNDQKITGKRIFIGLTADEGIHFNDGSGTPDMKKGQINLPLLSDPLMPTRQSFFFDLFFDTFPIFRSFIGLLLFLSWMPAVSKL